jgi:hypothetical protein
MPTKHNASRGNKSPSDKRLTARKTQQLLSPDDSSPGVETDLSRLIDQMESIHWPDVPGISTPEAAAWTARLDEARDATQTGAQGGD